MPRAVFFTHLSPDLAGLLTQHSPPNFDVTVHPSTLPNDEKIPLVQHADFIILFGGTLSEPVLRSAQNLKLIQLVSAGYEHMDLSLCRELGIPVANNGGANAIDVSEHTLTLILGCYRRLIEQDHNVRSENYRDINTGRTTYTIHGKTTGIVGFGNIGQKVARLLHAFDAHLLYADAYPAAAEIERDLHITRTDLDALLSESDIVTLHVPLTDATRGLIGERELGLMKSTALLINTCRGPVIDQPALVEALAKHRILAAGLDVQDSEPPDPNDPLLTLDNVLLTPHSAGVTYDTWSRRGRFIFENFQRVLQGQTPLAIVKEY